MSSANVHISGFLDYYCDLESPEYAVLIKGPWGSGKSRFITDYLNKRDDVNGKSLYVSLYGISTVPEIEDEFFRQVHPLLASKGAKLAGKLFKGLIRATIKVDLDGDGDSDGSIAVRTPSEGFLKEMQSLDGRVLVFDDLERCSIPIVNLLGYINSFVEHSGLKVVLIANEEEIIAKARKDEHINATQSEGGSATQYEKIKEKLIGKWFEITPEIDDALTCFVEQIRCHRAKEIASENHALIMEIYHASGYKNMRTLRHSLLEYERMFATLSEPLQLADSNAFQKQFLTLFLAYSLEIANGSIDISILEKIGNIFLGYTEGPADPSREGVRQKIRQTITKYYVFDISETIFSSSLWTEWFRRGFVETETISDAVMSSKYFRSTSQPDWIQLWHAEDLSDSDFSRILEEVNNSWNSKVYTEVGEVKHIVGILLWLSKAGLHEVGEDAILESAKDYVNHLKDTGSLLQSREQVDPFADQTSWHGLSFRSSDNPLFQELVTYLAEKKEEALVETYPSEACHLLAQMVEDTPGFARAIVLSNHQDNRYYDTPILAYMNEHEFVRTLIQLDQDKRRLVARALNERYKVIQLRQKLYPEKDFLLQVAELLRQESTRNAGRMSGYTLSTFAEYCIMPSLEILDTSNEDAVYQ